MYAMVRRKTVKLHAPPEFRRYLKIEAAEKGITMQDVMRSLAKNKEKVRKEMKKTFWGKI